MVATTGARRHAMAATNRALVVFVSALLILPAALFAIRLQPAAAAVSLAGCAGALVIVIRTPQRGGFLSSPIETQRLALSIALAVAVLLLGGGMHLFYNTTDWLIRDAVLADLASADLPIAYRFADTDYILRAPLAMYMVPALVGRMFGLYAAHVALLVQNSLFLGAIFYVIGASGRGWPQVWIMILFAGCSILGIGLLALAGLPLVPMDGFFVFGLDAWNPVGQYSASLIQFFWVPNHALPGWWLALLLLLNARGDIDTATVGASVGAAMFWSPLAILPAALWLGLRIVARWRESLASRRLWLLAPVAVCFAPIAIYLTLGAGGISHGIPARREGFWALYCIFVVAEFLQIAFLTVWREHVPREFRGLLWFSALALLLLPLVRFGPSNDLVMRGSIVALTVVAFCFAYVTLDPAARLSRARVAGLLLVGLCAPSAALELARSVLATPYEISDCSLFEANAALGGRDAPSNYAISTDRAPAWLMRTENRTYRPSGTRQCWSHIILGPSGPEPVQRGSQTVPNTDSR